MEFLLQHLLINSAKRHPDREAVRSHGEAMTYAQLDALSNQVASVLRGKGVRRGDRVGIYVHKSFASIVGVYGILKAGGVYVPLDPNAPAKRLAYITRDCGIRVLLTSPANAGGLDVWLAEGAPLATVILMEDTPADGSIKAGPMELVTWSSVLSTANTPVEPPGTIATDLAYILYTSGSTGMPKGVMISHQTIFTFINWSRDTFRLTCEDRVTSHAPLHFDLSTFDIYATTQAGGTIILIPEKLSTLPVQLVALLQNERVTVTYLVPSILALMVNYGELGRHDLSSLRAILFAGEVFPMKYLRRLVAAIPQADYYNLYGPTETNVCTYYQMQTADLDVARGDRPLPIGQACANMEVFAIDESGAVITAPGEEGELWARGPCVAQGYWGDRDKTARSFVPNTYQAMYAEVAYRTGDIVMLAEDCKNWIYVGRRDHMIKTRGYRVELGEIENALYGHEDVKEAVAVAIPDSLLGNRIRAFVVLAPGSRVTPRELESVCLQTLPKYMIPERFELRDVLPKTSSGKIDRAALSVLK